MEAAPTGSLAYRGEPDVFVAAAQWVQGVLLGSLSTTITVIAVATVGLLMLSGRLNLRRGATVIVGCFILFGAASIAQGLLSMGGARETYVAPASAPPVIASVDPALIAPAPSADQADPYAGAAFRR